MSLLLLGSDKSRILVDIYFPKFTSILMTFYQNHYTVVKLTFDLSYGVTQQISEHARKKWESAWLILSSEKYSWFTIDHSYWKRNQTVIEVSDDPKVWLETDNNVLTGKEKKILLNDTEWLNDINGVIHLVRTQIFRKINISYPLIRTRTYPNGCRAKADL